MCILFGCARRLDRQFAACAAIHQQGIPRIRRQVDDRSFKLVLISFDHGKITTVDNIEVDTLVQ